MKRVLIALTVIAIFLAVFLPLAGCGGLTVPTTNTSTTPTTSGLPGTKVTVTGGTYNVISAAQLAAMQRSSFTLVDVDETPTIVIPGTDLFIKDSVLLQNLDKLPDKSANIVVVCIVGVTSQDAAAKLVGAGYTNVMDLDGGVMRWQALGYTVEAYTPTT
jgi:phage shock protein E